MLGRYRFLLVLALGLFLVPQVVANKQPPKLRSFSADRFELAAVINDETFIVGKGELASPMRAHFVLKAIETRDEPEETLEVVEYDGTTYVRENDDPDWYVDSTNSRVTPPTFRDIDEALRIGTVTYVQSMMIAGVQTDQFQFWIKDPSHPTDHATIDFWIGQQDDYPYQVQISEHVTDPDFGHLKLEEVYRLYAFDDPSIKVGPPPDAISPATTAKQKQRTTFTLSRSPGLRKTLNTFFTAHQVIEKTAFKRLGIQR